MITWHRLVLVLLSVQFLSCSNSEDQNNDEPNNRLERNGVFINHTICGTGDITLLFVHGWCIDQTYWTSQLDEFCVDYKLVAIDLPGFGESGINRTNWSIEEYGQDVSWVIQQLKLKNVILIGHSMGGDIIVEAALANKEVIALVGVDNFKDVGMEINDELRSEVEGFFGMLRENFSVIAPAYAEGILFHPSTDSLIKKRVMLDFSTSDSLAAIASLESLFEYSPKEVDQLSKLDQKLYLINSDATPTDTVALDNTGVAYEIVDINATGHYPMIEKPEDFNFLLRQIIKIIEKDRGSAK